MIGPSDTDVLSTILGHARRDPDHPAVRDNDRQLTYAELLEEVGRLAGGLDALGVGPGDRVALHLPNSVEFVVAALASLWVGALFVPLAVTDPEARVDAIVADCSPAIVVTGPGHGGQRPEPGSGGPGVPPQRREYADLLAPSPIVPPTDAPHSDRLAYAIYTSGTTGTPKGVLIGNRAFLAAVRSTAELLGLDQRTRTLCVSPFHFDGSFATLFPTLAVGGTVVIRPREALLFPRTFFRAVRDEGITYTGFSPSYLKLLLASPQMAELEGGTLEIIALGGEASALADIRAVWAAAPQVRVFNRYGPTETTIAVTHVELTEERVADGTVPLGHPHPGVTFLLVDDEDSPVDGPDRPGELYVGGVQLMAGYWGSPELTGRVLRTDLVPGAVVYRTGDVAYRNRRGEYVYLERADRVVKRSGVRISLVEVADAVRGLPGVTDAACVVFDDEGAVGIAAFVVTDRPVDGLELRRGAAQHLPDSMLPDRIERVPALPLTTSGKLDERGLLGGAGLDPPGSAVPSTAPSRSA